MSRILITGGKGFIGSHLVSQLKVRHELFILGRTPPLEGVCSPLQWITQDLTQPLDYSRFPERLDVIIHLAQSRHYREFPDHAKDIFDVNVGSTFRLLEYARKIRAKCFIFASSGGVYGNSYERFVETDPVNPLNFYLSSKYTAELLIANYHSFFRTVVFRFFFVYGPGQKGMLVPNLLRNVMEGKRITIDGNPGLRINPIYIDDAVRVFEPAIHISTSALFNVAGNESATITELVGHIEQVTNRKAVLKYSDTPSGGDLIGDNSRMKEVLEVLPNVSLVEGLRRIVKHSMEKE